MNKKRIHKKKKHISNSEYILTYSLGYAISSLTNTNTDQRVSIIGGGSLFNIGLNLTKSADLGLLDSALVGYFIGFIQKVRNNPLILEKLLQQGGQNLNDTIKNLQIY